MTNKEAINYINDVKKEKVHIRSTIKSVLDEDLQQSLSNGADPKTVLLVQLCRNTKK